MRCNGEHASKTLSWCENMKKNERIILPPFQNKCLNFILNLIQSWTKVQTFILGRMEYVVLPPRRIWIDAFFYIVYNDMKVYIPLPNIISALGVLYIIFFIYISSVRSKIMVRIKLFTLPLLVI